MPQLLRSAKGLGMLLLLGSTLPAISRPPAIPHGLVRARIAHLADRERRPYDKPGEALEFYAKKRAPRGETQVPVERYLTALEQMRGMAQHSILHRAALPSRAVTEQGGAPARQATEATVAWRSLGPGNIGGRTRAIVIDPTAPRTIYAAAVNGGVWKTTDAGRSWTPLTDFLNNIAVNSLVMDPNNPQVLYAGTGEGYFNIDRARGLGIYTTSDGGATWSLVPGTSTFDFVYVNHLEVSPASGMLYAATGTGVWRLDRAHGTWTRTFVPPPKQFGGCLDLKLRVSGGNDVAFAACSTFVQGAVYQNKAAQAAGAWTPVLRVAGQGRTSLAIAPSNPNVIYAMLTRNDDGPRGEYNQGLLGVYRSTAGGDSGTWSLRASDGDGTRLNTRLLSNAVIASLVRCGFGGPDFFLNQGWYDNVLAVDPVNPDRVWAGGIDLFRSDDGGKNWGLASYWWASGFSATYAHADHHAIVFHPNYDGVTNKVMYDGSDGGIFRTYDALATVARGKGAECDPNNTNVTWVNLNNGYSATQFYDGTVFPGGTRFFGGTQDNGTDLGDDHFGANDWVVILGGDGGYVAVNPNDQNTLYAENTGLSLAVSPNGGLDWFDATHGIAESPFDFLFITPFTMDPNNPNRLWIGGAFLWRTEDGGQNWSRASRLIAGPVGSAVTAIGVAQGNSDAVMAGTDSGFVMFVNNGTKTNGLKFWPSSQPADGYVSWVAFDPHQSNVAYATYSTFGVHHVWKSTDGGANWSSIDGSGAGALPDIPVNSIVVDPASSNRLYVGTDLGVFTSGNGGTSWSVLVTGFPNTRVENLIILTSPTGRRTLFAFTHGRGAWKTPLS